MLVTAKVRLALEQGCLLPLLLTISKAAVKGREGFPTYWGKTGPRALLSTIAALAACILSVNTIRFLRSPGLMLSELKGRRTGTAGDPWVVVGAREACRELELEEEEEGVGGNGEFNSLCAI